MLVIWGLPYGLIGVYDLLQGQGFLPSDSPLVSQIVPNWLPQVWFILGAIAFVAVTFEGAYRLSTYRSKREGAKRANYYSGYVHIGKVRAGANLEVMAKVGDYTSAPVTTNPEGYYYSLEVIPPNDSYIGQTTQFYVEGKKASPTVAYMGGRTHE